MANDPQSLKLSELYDAAEMAISDCFQLLRFPEKELALYGATIGEIESRLKKFGCDWQ